MIQRNQLTGKQKTMFQDPPYKRTIIRTHDSTNKNLTELMVMTDMKRPMYSKSKREKEVMNKLLKKECLFEFLSISTVYIQALQKFLEGSI